MKIKEFSRKSGVSEHTIRFYEARGLLRPSRNESGYRVYSGQDSSVLADILMGQKLGFSLAEIRTGIDLWRSGQLDQATKVGLVSEKLEETVSKIAELQAVADYLQAKLAWIQADEVGECPLVPLVDGRVIAR